ncbi:MAG: hypothetical protein GAK35_02390 [Herbaspirillum frisingense]|uniref:Tail fiber protein n=1 Tax=Herbaspirillum frisingense TaxID=92645 RepID=A0A7V8JU96_9BURK|nr:MAG: hypothetical protein GAK35_02390 [Herbaspirillum frisingense]
MLLPSKELLNGSKTPATTYAEMRGAFGQLYDYLAAFLGTDSDDKAGARARLGVINTVFPPGMLGMFFTKTAPDSWLKANGTAVAVSSYVDLATAIYCGDAANATALWGYRCTSNSNPNGTRSTTGAYIVLPDARGEFIRGWDDSRGIDASRNFWAWQAGQLLSHNHTASAATDGYHQHTYVSGNQGVGYQVGGASPVRENAGGDWTGGGGSHSHVITVNATGGAENLVRNLPTLICIKY